MIKRQLTSLRGFYWDMPRKNGISFIIWLFFHYLIHVWSMFCHMILWNTCKWQNEKMSNVWQNLVCSHTFLFLMLALCIHPNCIEKAYIVLFTMWCWTSPGKFKISNMTVLLRCAMERLYFIRFMLVIYLNPFDLYFIN